MFFWFPYTSYTKSLALKIKIVTFKLFTNILSVFLDMSNKTDDDRKQFFISHCRTFYRYKHLVEIDSII